MVQRAPRLNSVYNDSWIIVYRQRVSCFMTVTLPMVSVKAIFPTFSAREQMFRMVKCRSKFFSRGILENARSVVVS